jgi:hypothetical protein
MGGRSQGSGGGGNTWNPISTDSTSKRVIWAIGTGGASELARAGADNPSVGWLTPGGTFGTGYRGGQDTLKAINAPLEESRRQSEELMRQQREMAEKAAAEKTAADEALAKEQAKQQAGLDMKSAKQRQARLASGAKGRSDTILTGPLGLTASGPKSGRTLLGS